MLNFFKRLLTGSNESQPIFEHSASETSNAFTIRFGKATTVDEVFYAWTSCDIQRMLAALDTPTNPIDRHFLLMNLVKESYKKRSQPEMATICANAAELHLREFPDLIEPLRQDMGVLPRVPTFQHYATLLTERGEFERAIFVCQQALGYGLHDHTKSGYEGRIQRIKKAQARHSA